MAMDRETLNGILSEHEAWLEAAPEEHIRSLPPSQTATLDRIIDTDGPTTSYAVTTSAPPPR